MNTLSAFDNIMMSVTATDARHVPAAMNSSVNTDANDASKCLLLRVLDALDYGLMLVSDTGKLRFANRVAQGECARTQCMRLEAGFVQAVQDRDNKALQKAMMAASAGRRSMVTTRSRDSVLSIGIVPVDKNLDRSRCPAILLVFSRSKMCEPLSVEFFAREHRVTMAEEAVLRGLCNGMPPAEIANHCGVALSTVRTQIGSLRQKTESKSIGELLRMVAVLPPIVPLLNY